MRFKQINPVPVRQKYRIYSPSKLTDAYLAVREGMSVLRASRTHGVPETTLRDRVQGRIEIDTVVMGKAPLFSQLEEVKLFEHFEFMAAYGYGYTQQECVDVATDFAVSLGKRTHENPPTEKWLRGFKSRWPKMKTFNPRALDYARAKMTREDVVKEYFRNLEHCIKINDLEDKPHLIFNIDEKGLSTNHKPPGIVSTSCPSAVTSGKGQTVTCIGCGSASGVAVPPYFIFPGQRMNFDLMKGASPGAVGTVSETGWSNGNIFRTYLESHFLKFVPGRSNEKILIILDGHGSHFSVGLVDWAKSLNILLFILPAHTSHILQPLDVSCYGAFATYYNFKCHQITRQLKTCITKFDICKFACHVYSKALSSDNLQSGFRKTGIYPLNNDVVPKDKLLPGEVFRVDGQTSNDSDATVEGGEELPAAEEASRKRPIEFDNSSSESDACITLFKEREEQLIKVKSQGTKKPRKTVYKIVSGKEITSDEISNKLSDYINEKKKPSKACNKSSTNKLTKSNKTQKLQNSSTQICPNSPQPGPSHINLAVDSSDDSDESDEIRDDDKCCVCHRFTPEEVSKSVSVIFTKWAQCDGDANGTPCKHWTHLIYCCKTRVVRRGDKFFCPHCLPVEE